MKEGQYTINMKSMVFLLCLNSFSVYDTVIQAVWINSAKLLFLLLLCKQDQSCLLFVSQTYSNTFNNLVAVTS